MTNVILIAATLLTNRTEVVSPSGQMLRVREVVSAVSVIPLGDKTVTNVVPVLTNTVRWQRVVEVPVIMPPLPKPTMMESSMAAAVLVLPDPVIPPKYYRVTVTNGPAPVLQMGRMAEGLTMVQPYRWLGAGRLTISNHVMQVDEHGGSGELRAICTNGVHLFWQAVPTATYTMWVSTNMVDWEDLKQDFTGYSHLNFYDGTP